MSSPSSFRETLMELCSEWTPGLSILEHVNWLTCYGQMKTQAHGQVMGKGACAAGSPACLAVPTGSRS